MMIIFLALACVAGIVLAVALGVGLWLLARAGSHDAVSTAREDWVSRRSDSDRRGW
ncbi:MAG: hypothetical protein Kow0031_05360 [Anaerolineae bacterium]